MNYLLLASSKSAFFFPLVVAIVVCGIVSYYYFNKKAVILRKLSRTPLKRSNNFKTNEVVTINGKALHVEAPLIAPFSKRKCVFYTMTIEQKKSSGKNSYWDTIISEEKIQTFFIENNGDFVIVEPTKNPKNYYSYLVQDKTAQSGTFNDPTPKFKALLEHYNIDSENFFGFNKGLRYSEGIIEIGEQLTVAGVSKWKQLKEPLPEYPYTKIAALVSNDKQKLIITDLPEAKKQSKKLRRT